MKNKSEGSCSKGCLCDTCSGQSKSIKSEAFAKKVAGLIQKAKNTATVELGKMLPDADPDMSGPLPGIGVVVNPLAAKIARNPTVKKAAGKVSGAISNVAKKAAQIAPAIAEEYYGSAEHLEDLKSSKKEHLQNADQAEKQKNYIGAQRYRQMAKEVAQRITNHPLNQKAESMLKESKFVLGDTVVSKEPIQGMQPGHHYKVVDVKRTPSPIGNFVVHTLMHENGSKIRVNNLHAMPVERVPFADKGHVDLAKRYPQNEELKTVDDVTKTLPRGVEKKGPGEAYGNVDKCAPVSKDKDKTVVAGKTGEEYSKKPQTEVKEMSEDKYAKLAEAAFGSFNKNNPFRNTSKMEEKVEQMDEGDVIQFKPKPTPKPSKVITTATRRPAGPRPVKENLNQRFPDVEKDITAIMKESYKKKKMMENATNIHIATPEQREDWLNVGRGSMDVLDYINKYKV